MRALSPALWNLRHLTALYLNDNHLTRLPPEVSRLYVSDVNFAFQISLLTNLLHLDLSSNKLRSLPSELGNMLHLRELLLNYNQLRWVNFVKKPNLTRIFRVLPYELGRLFQLQTLGLNGNPLPSEIIELYSAPNGTYELIGYLLDNQPPNMEQPGWFLMKQWSFWWLKSLFFSNFMKT